MMISQNWIGFGPIRQQRIGAGTSIPLLILVAFWGEVPPIMRVVIILIGGFAAYRAFRMGIERRGEKLIVRDFLTSVTIDLSAVQSVQFHKVRGVVYRLTLKTQSGQVVGANGVSTNRRAFPEISPDRTRQEERARARLETFFQATHVSYVPPSIP